MRISAPFSPRPHKAPTTYSFPMDIFYSESMFDGVTGRNIVPITSLKRSFLNNAYQFVRFDVGTIYSDIWVSGGEKRRKYYFSKNPSGVPGWPYTEEPWFHSRQFYKSDLRQSDSQRWITIPQSATNFPFTVYETDVLIADVVWAVTDVNKPTLVALFADVPQNAPTDIYEDMPSYNQIPYWPNTIDLAYWTYTLSAPTDKSLYIRFSAIHRVFLDWAGDIIDRHSSLSITEEKKVKTGQKKQASVKSGKNKV